MKDVYKREEIDELFMNRKRDDLNSKSIGCDTVSLKVTQPLKLLLYSVRVSCAISKCFPS